MDLQHFLRKNLLVAFTHSAMLTFSTWFFVTLLTTNHASISLFGLVQKGWSVFSGTIFANGHVEKADEPKT